MYRKAGESTAVSSAPIMGEEVRTRGLTLAPRPSWQRVMGGSEGQWLLDQGNYGQDLESDRHGARSQL